MKVLVTGADGFVGRNLVVSLREHAGMEVLPFTRQGSAQDLKAMVAAANAIIHLAGVNRPKEEAEFAVGNTDLTAQLCDFIGSSGRRIPVIYASTIQAERDNPYGRSKLAAERALQTLHQQTGNPVVIYRLPNVFGKWCRPNYNSAVATFCHNVARDLPLQINDPAVPVTLVYIDDVVAALIASIAEQRASQELFAEVRPQYQITVGELADRIRSFKDTRRTLGIDAVGNGLLRALYATYISYLPPQDFSYPIPAYSDARGVFVEMLKTPDAGQFSYFTAHAGITRGGHYHHSKTEKFLVIRGHARFRFRHLITGETYELFTSGDQPQIVDTIPGWAHDITNVGADEMIVMLWANEVFDRSRPDTVTRLI